MSVIPGLNGNAALNPTCHTLGGWYNLLSNRTSLTLDTVKPISGPLSAMVTYTDVVFSSLAYIQITGGYVTPANPDDFTDPAFRAVPVTPGNKVTWTLDVRCDVACTVDVGLFPFDALGEQIPWDVPGLGAVYGVEEIHTVAANTVARVGCTILIPDGCTFATMSIIVDAQGATVQGTRTWFDNLLIEPDSTRDWVPPDQFGYHPADTYDPGYYCDGDTDGYAWIGGAGQSATILAEEEVILPAFVTPPAPVTLGCGEPTVYLYDRGGQQRLYRFEAGAVVGLEWNRVLSDTSQATLTIDAALCDCDWLGRIRAVRHELVIYRDHVRVWEGPITRVAYSQTRVKVIAKDLSWWFHRRAVTRKFATDNAVVLAKAYAEQAFLHDDPNARAYLQANVNKGATYTTAHNDADAYVIDAIDELVEAGVDWTVLGRRIFFWASINPVGQTNLMRTGLDLAAEVTVFEDGESLVTRAWAVGGDTWGMAILAGSDLPPAAAAVMPVTTNYAHNPSLKIDTTGFDPFTTRFFTVTRLTSGWASAAGGTYGKVGVKIPAGGTARSDYNSYEMVLSMAAQAIDVSKGEQITATLLIRPTGVNFTRLSLMLRGKYADGTVDDRSFVEGPPVQTKSGTDALLYVTGNVPEGIVSCWVEVARETNEVQWKNAADGFWFDRFGLWRGRAESWFDGDTPKTADYTYQWSGTTPTQTTSTRFFRSINPAAPQTWPTETEYQNRISPYYGILDNIEDSQASTRTDLETAAKATLMRSFPSPLGVDIPQNAPLLPNAPVTINELMPGTIMPLQSRATCRHIGAMPVLDVVKVAYTDKGEKITATLVAAQAWEVDAPPDPGTEPEPEQDPDDLPD